MYPRGDSPSFSFVYAHFRFGPGLALSMSMMNPSRFLILAILLAPFTARADKLDVSTSNELDQKLAALTRPGECNADEVVCAHDVDQKQTYSTTQTADAGTFLEAVEAAL